MKPDTVTKDRHLHIGGSEISTILGINHFKKRYALLLEKAQIVDNYFKGNEYTEFGNVIEPKIRDYINKKYNLNLEEECNYNGYFRLNNDGQDKENDTMIEIKSTSQIKKTLKGYKHYLVQLITYMHFEGISKGMLVVYHRPKDFDTTFNKELLQVFKIDLDDYKELIEEILLECEKFWQDLEKVKLDYIFEDKILTEKEL